MKARNLSTTILVGFIAIILLIVPFKDVHACFDNTDCPPSYSCQFLDPSDPTSGTCVYVSPGSGGPGAIENPIKSEDFQEILDRVMRVLVAVALPIYGLVMGFGVYYLMTSGNNPGNKQKARKIFMYSTIGFLIIVLSMGIAALIQGIII